MVVVKTKLRHATIEKDNEYFVIKADSVFIDSNPSLKCDPTMINTEILHNTSISLIIPKISDKKVCAPKNITIGTSGDINSHYYSINEIALCTSKDNAITLTTSKNGI